MPRSSPPKTKSAERRAFEHYLRTGRRLAPPTSAPAAERKFNPYHDPRNGRFTFAPGGPKSLQNALFSDRRGLWKPKESPDGAATAEKPPDVRERADGESSNTHPRAPTSTGGTTSPSEPGATAGEFPTADLKIYLPFAPPANGALQRISATDDGADYANCPEGGNCRATATIEPRNSNDVDIALNEYRRSIRDYGWKDNDFQNLVDMRRALIALKQKEKIAARINDWDPTTLLPEKWIAENAVDLALSDPDDLIGAVAYYLTLGIDGPGPPPPLWTLENFMNPAEAALTQARWATKELLHQSYLAMEGSDPIFESTVPVNVSGKRAIDRSDPYEVEVRRLYGGDPNLRPPRFHITLDGKTVSGQADSTTLAKGKYTAIDAKYTRGWSSSLRNPSSNVGDKPFSERAQREMIEQARKYISVYAGGVIYHTNSLEFARFYTKVFDEAGITNYSFVITPAR